MWFQTQPFKCSLTGEQYGLLIQLVGSKVNITVFWIEELIYHMHTTVRHHNNHTASCILEKIKTDDTKYLYPWIKIDQLDATRFIISPFPAQHVLNVSTSIFRSLRLTVVLFHVLYFSGSMCVGVTVWFGWGGVVSLYSKSQAPEDGCTNIRNMLSSKWWNNKASDIKLVYLYSKTLTIYRRRADRFI